MNGSALVPEFDHEMAGTRRMLERVPDDQLSFRPHEKSYSLLQLASHIGNIPSWTSMILGATELDLSQPFDRMEPTNGEEIRAEFEAGVEAARAALQNASAEDLMVDWTLRMGDHEIFKLPRVGVYRSMMMSHLIHHRAQLTVYYRLVGVPVPGIYGPSADEPNL